MAAHRSFAVSLVANERIGVGEILAVLNKVLAH